MKWKLPEKELTPFRIWIIPRMINNILPFLGGLAYGLTGNYWFIFIGLIPVLANIEIKDYYLKFK